MTFIQENVQVDCIYDTEFSRDSSRANPDEVADVRSILIELGFDSSSSSTPEFSEDEQDANTDDDMPI